MTEKIYNGREPEDGGADEYGELYGSGSPFAYRPGAQIMTDRTYGERGVTVKYMRYCCNKGIINAYDNELLMQVYRSRYMNARMLKRIFDGRTERSVKRCIHKLVKDGFLKRQYMAYAGGLVSPYFYSVTRGVSDYYSSLGFSSVRADSGTVTAMKLLATGQFRAALLSCPSFGFMSEDFSTVASIGDYRANLGWTGKISCRGRDFRFAPVAVRGDDFSADMLLSPLKERFCLSSANEMVLPVVICEDEIKLAAAAKAVSTDQRLTDRTVLYVSDGTLTEDDAFSHLITYREGRFFRTSFA